MSEPDFRDLGRRFLKRERYGALPPQPRRPTRAEKILALIGRADTSPHEREAARRALSRLNRRGSR